MAFIARSLRKGPHTWAARGAWEPRDCPESLWYGFYHITEVGARTTCTRAQPTLRYDVHTRLARRLEHVHNSSTPPGALLDVYDARSHVCKSMYTMCRRGLWYTRYTTGTRAHTAQGSGTAYPGSTPGLKPTAWSLNLAQHRTSRSSLTQTLTSRRPGGAAAPDEEARGPGPAWPSPCASAPAARADRSARHRW